MRQARPYKPAPKSASANRIRERYLHQLGLQRGAGVGAPLTPPQSSHVVVISGLPSLPEDRATTEHVMECHDFSISRHSQHTGPGSVDAHSFGDNDGEMSDSGSAQGCTAHKRAALSGDASSHCSKSTLSVSPSNNTAQREADGALTSMALAYPSALRKIPPPAKPTPPPSNNNTLPFSLSHSVPWRSTTSLSKSASFLLDSADHDSVSSYETSTTAESSLTAAMVSRDWGTKPHSTGGESPAETPGVYFQCGHPSLLGSNHCHTTSSLAHALNRFNIDSDCEASVASNSVVEDHIMDEDDASFDDAASRTSVNSHTSAGSRRKKIGKTQRLMNRAAAHERILQIRNDRSQKMRANLVHSQRMNNQVSISGLSSAMAHEEQHAQHCDGAGSVSSQASIPLVHVQHASPNSSQDDARKSNHHTRQSSGSGDLGRTPTSSNCSEMRKLKALGSPSNLLASLPVGVHQNIPGSDGDPSTMMAPLRFHPMLAARIPTPPQRKHLYAPSSARGIMLPYDNLEQAHPISKPSLAEAESIEAQESTSLQYTDYNQATVDDVMEVATTLSSLRGMGRTGPIPRIR